MLYYFNFAKRDKRSVWVEGLIGYSFNDNQGVAYCYKNYGYLDQIFYRRYKYYSFTDVHNLIYKEI